MDVPKEALVGLRPQSGLYVDAITSYRQKEFAMYLSLRFMPFTVMVFVATAYAHSLAQSPPLPEDQRIRYTIREQPTDPSSDVIWTVDLELTAPDSAGNLVGWLIDNVTVSEVDALGDPVNVWVDPSPELDSPDGLWWVEHADTNNPQLDEFALPPLLLSTATAEVGAGVDLDYLVEGVPYDPPPGDPLSEYVTTGLDYAFTLVGNSLPEHEGDDEPVTIDDVQDQPIG